MILRLIMVVLLFSSVCSAQTNDFDWLVGKWQLKGKQSFETWAPSGDRLIGKSFKISGQDTTFLEEILIERRDGNFHYVPDVAGEQGPIPFKIVQYTKHGFTAENPYHDFSKLIRYTRVERDGVVMIDASIEGDGKVIPYTFVQVN